MLSPGSRRSPTRTSLGTASLSISNLLVFSSTAKVENPVTLPPGRARLATRPSPTGSPTFVITMGMVVVALLAANTDTPAIATIRSTLRRTRSAASSFRRSAPLFSAKRYSKVIFFPSIQPSLRISCRNASKSPAIPEAMLLSRKPMRKTFPVCCASAGTQSAKSKGQSARRIKIFLINCSPVFCCALAYPSA